MGNHDDFITIELNDTIDLHAFHPKDAAIILEEFIHNAAVMGYYTVEIIHGKGNSVLKNIVHNYLKKDLRVERFYDKPGNWGATVVHLIKREF